MATVFTNGTQTYNGPVATKWYTAMLLKGTTMSRLAQAGSIHPGVKSKVQMPSINMGESTVAGDCTFTAAGTWGLATKILEVAPLKVNKVICERDLDPLIFSANVQAGSNNADFIAPEVLDAILMKQADVVNIEVERLMWMGNTAGATGTFLDLIDGYLVKFLADATVIDVVGVLTNVGNIQSQLQAIYSAIPEVMLSRLGDESVGIWLSPKNMSLYKQSLVNAFNNPNVVGLQPMYIDCKLFETTGLTQADMVFADAKNLWAGVDLLDEENEIKKKNKKAISGAPTAHLIMNYKLGVNHAVGAEIVWWHRP